MIDRFAIYALILAIGSAANTASAQASIPAPVIQQCNELASANDLPDCLRQGAVAFEMLAEAQSKVFYGSAALQVINICAEKNDTFYGAWICFDNAAEDAVDTRNLIGLENIADECVAAISDPSTYERLDELYQSLRQAMFPDQSYFGGEMYFAFTGCPKPPASEVGELEGASSQTTVAPKDTLSRESCVAYSELEDLIASSSTIELREVYSELEGSDDESPSAISAITGLSIEALSYIIVEDDSGESNTADGMFTMSLLGALVRDYHPVLFDELIVELTSDETNEDDELAREMAQGVFLMIIDGAEEKYTNECR